MNKYQKALKELCNRCYVESEKCTCHPKYKGGKCNNNCEHKQALQELIDEKIPMKVTEKWSDDCPKCGKFMIDTCKYALHNIPFIKYCPHCGQKLDWSDTYE